MVKSLHTLILGVLVASSTCTSAQLSKKRKGGSSKKPATPFNAKPITKPITKLATKPATKPVTKHVIP